MTGTEVGLILAGCGTLLTAIGQVIGVFYTRRLEKNTNHIKDELVAEVRKASIAQGKKEQKDNPS